MPISKTDLIYREDGSIYHLGLQPEQIPDIVLTVGDPERVPMVSRYFDAVEEKVSHREFVAHIGRVGERSLIVISSGMGTDNVEILMTELDALVNIDRESRTVHADKRSLIIIRLGTSGALQPDVPLDSVLLSRMAFGVDTLMQFYPYATPPQFQAAAQQLGADLSLDFAPYVAEGSAELLKVFQSEFRTGCTLTCPGFYAPQGREVRLAPRQHVLLKKLVDFRCSEGALTNLEMETAGYYALGQLLGHQMLSVNAILAHRPSGQFSSAPQQTVNFMIEQVLSRIGEL
jgi:uridine phosphorylase